MKVRMLKKLRKRFRLDVRHNKIRVWDVNECLGGIIAQTDFISPKEAYAIRREWILEEARKSLRR